MEKGCGHIDVLKTFPGDTVCKYIYIYIKKGLWSNFNCSSMNPMMHRQTDRLFVLYSMDITCKSVAAYDLLTYLSF